MTIVETLAPLVLLISLGAVLSRIHFLGPRFMGDLNALAFWVAMPALLFESAAEASIAAPETWRLLGVILAATFLVGALAWALAPAIGVPRAGRGTLTQSAFRANLALIGIPVVASAFRAGASSAPSPALTTAVIVMTLTMAFYNVFAITVLQASRGGEGGVSPALFARSILSNPLLVAGLTGLVLGLGGVPVPVVLKRTLEMLGSAAVPIALLCIGGSLMTSRLEGRRSWIVWAAALKVGLLPLVVWILSRAAGLGATEHRIALIFAASPTAAAAYIMARQMDGDEILASGSVAMSTMLSVVSLAVVLWLTQ